MDLNASPEPEEDQVFPHPHYEEDNNNARKQGIIYNEHGYQYHQFKRQRVNNNSNLPPGWFDCPAFGQEIGFLIPSKVPLAESFDDFIPSGKRYSYRHVIHQQQRVLGRKLGMVIDLTNSSRYYNPIDWKKKGIEHVKIACKGRDSVPENEAVNKFFYEVSRFLETTPKTYVLVHCTHGHNRTGYMIVHYLMRTRPNLSVTEAIRIFSDACPPGIYKPDYIDALHTFYHEKKPDSVLCPPIPEWKRSPDHFDPIGDDDVKESQLVKMTNDDILGDEIPRDQEIELQHFCYQSMKLPCRGNIQFPGSHPVSLNWENLRLLRQRYYYATWKADGTRYMMLITKDGCYLIDRRFNFRRVQMRFPCSNGAAFHHFTLLDGEMVIDTVPESKKQERRYLIYDAMAINNVSVVDRPFHERWKMIETQVIEPRNYERRKMHSFYRYDMEPFRVRRKDFWPLSTVMKLVKGFIPKLPHAADGLVFQGSDDRYVPRTHEGLLKWKYPEMNSVDFLFEMVDNRQSLYLFERGMKKRLMENSRVVFPDGSDDSTYSGKIIECSWDSEQHVWVCMRVRTDKGTPNGFYVYRKVMTSINDNITEDVLLDEINRIIRLPIYSDTRRR